MPTTQFPFAAGDGWLAVNKSSGSYSASFTAARGASSADSANAANANYGPLCYLGGGFGFDVDMYRGFMAADTSPITAAGTISAATLYLYCFQQAQDLGGSLCLVAGSQASVSTLAVSDFTSVGTTEFATRKAFNTITANSWVALALNAAGLAAINKTGYTKLALRSSNDLDNSSTGIGIGASYAYFRPSEYTTDTTKRPYLEVDYTLPGGGNMRRRDSGLMVPGRFVR